MVGTQCEQLNLEVRPGCLKPSAGSRGWRKRNTEDGGTTAIFVKEVGPSQPEAE
jgi:hypothetical protein